MRRSPKLWSVFNGKAFFARRYVRVFGRPQIDFLVGIRLPKIFIRDQIDAWSLSLIKRQGVPQSVVGAELLRKGLNLLAQAAGPAEAVRHMTKLAEDLASNVPQQKS